MQQTVSKDQLWAKLEQLHPLQQQTVMALIDSLLRRQTVVDKRDKNSLRNLSVWTEEDLQPIQEAQDRMNAWQLPRLLIDTSIIIEHLRKQNRQKSILYNIVNNYALYTSTVCRI